MINLPVNQEPVERLLALLDGSPDQISFLTGIVQQHGAQPQEFYAGNPKPELDYAAMSALPAFKSQDWSRFAHPYVMAQLLVNLCEKANQPLPDNLYVGVEGAWQPLSYIQPTYKPAQAAAPVLVQPAAPVPAPAADPYPQPVPVAQTPPAPQSLTLQPEALDGELLSPEPAAQPMVQREVMGATVTMPAATAVQVDAARGALRTPAESPAPAAAAAPADVGLVGNTTPAAIPAAPQPAIPGAGQYGLPQPTLDASKGASPFDKDPTGEPPKTVQRQLRDVFEMMPRMFAVPAGDVVGKGTGSAQRHRVYLAAVTLLRQALASVPDPACPVGYLVWHLDHLRYNAANSAGGQTMLAFEKWLLQGEGE